MDFGCKNIYVFVVDVWRHIKSCFSRVPRRFFSIDLNSINTRNGLEIFLIDPLPLSYYSVILEYILSRFFFPTYSDVMSLMSKWRIYKWNCTYKTFFLILRKSIVSEIKGLWKCNMRTLVLGMKSKYSLFGIAK